MAITETDDPRTIPVLLDLHVIEARIVRLARAYFMESDGPDKQRLEKELLEALIEEQEIRRKRNR